MVNRNIYKCNCILTHWENHLIPIIKIFCCFVDLWRLLNMTGQWAVGPAACRPEPGPAQLLQCGHRVRRMEHCSDPADVPLSGSRMSVTPHSWPRLTALTRHWWPLTGRCFDSGPLRNCVVTLGGRGISGSYLGSSRPRLRVRESLCCQGSSARINNCITPTPLSPRTEASLFPDQANQQEISETMTFVKNNRPIKAYFFIVILVYTKRWAA